MTTTLTLLGVILVYCVSRLGSFDGDTALANLTPEMEVALINDGPFTIILDSKDLA